MPPYDDWGAWYTSAFALAFADVVKNEYETRLVECLDYVIENGNKLSCVASARERLAELG